MPGGKNHERSTPSKRVKLQVPETFWRALRQKSPLQLCNLTLFRQHGDRQLVFRFLNRDVMVDIAKGCLRLHSGDARQRLEDPLLELVVVNYLASVDALYPLGGEIVGIRDLKEGHFFQGPHALDLEPLLDRFGTDLEGFRQAMTHLGGETVDMADAAGRLWPLPRIPLYYLLWKGDEEFQPRISVLFDRSIESVLAADAIWGLVNRVTQAILEASGDLHPSGRRPGPAGPHQDQGE
jgi:hypothetical protein